MPALIWSSMYWRMRSRVTPDGQDSVTMYVAFSAICYRPYIVDIIACILGPHASWRVGSSDLALVLDNEPGTFAHSLPYGKVYGLLVDNQKMDWHLCNIGDAGHDPVIAQRCYVAE
jgi:hypothetical protein